jgi:hypothetical protein
MSEQALSEIELRKLYKQSLILVIHDVNNCINDLRKNLENPSIIPFGFLDMLRNSMILLEEKVVGYEEELTRVDVITLPTLKTFLKNTKEKYKNNPEFAFLQNVVF